MLLWVGSASVERSGVVRRLVQANPEGDYPPREDLMQEILEAFRTPVYVVRARERPGVWRYTAGAV